MPLSSAKLFDGLDNPPRETVEEAAEDFAEAYRAWFAEASGLLSTTPLNGAKASMKSALLAWDPNVSTGANTLQSGITAFWGVVSASAASLFSTATAATPPGGLGSIGSTLQGLGLNNDNVTNEQAMQAFANTIHTASLGGLWVLPAGATAPIA